MRARSVVLIEERGDFWSIPGNARCITTNGEIARSGNRPYAVMGRGVAKQAAMRSPDMPYRFAELLSKYGRPDGDCWSRPMKLMQLPDDGSWLVSYPVKYRWRERANLDLILDGTVLLREMADKFEWQRIVLVRPGCGNGGLDWVSEVQPCLVEMLDDRFVVAIPSNDEIQQAEAVSQTSGRLF